MDREAQHNQISKMFAVMRREFAGYFATPLGVVFIIVFLLTNSVATFYLGDYFAAGQADLQIFFSFQPWIYLFFLSAISMRLWAEERRNGSIELLLSLPIALPAIVMGKYLAALGFAGFALLGTLPIWFSVNYLGSPDNGVILSGYVGSFFVAAGYLAIGMCASACTRNQIIAFVVAVMACLLFTLSGAPLVLDLLRGLVPQILLDVIASFSVILNVRGFTNGVIDARALIFFISLIGGFLVATIIIVDAKRGDA